MAASAVTIFTEHMTEAELMDAIVQALELHGWRWFHDNDSRQNNAGFPDIVAVAILAANND